ncbi:hypothetical protein F5148DRAFT_1319381 [Russula earlei]|uniref:Uncharacterized protein n=1 Tax=Russula earlei TaxID=71964 RepID=A0ACC0UIZ9_9AGAM|nr:hypothetical protein F5148DRAFT_1319381 [Russula earlei]
MNGDSAAPPRPPYDSPTSSAARPSAPFSSTTPSQASPQLSLETLLSAHAEMDNPTISALEQCISERNLLSSQNTQLWKLIEKSRGLYTESQRNLERVRTERDAYKAMLIKLGENPDAIARGHRARERLLKPSSSSNGIRQGSERNPSPSAPTRHKSADTGLAADTESRTLTPDWLPSLVPPTVTVSHHSSDPLDASAIQTMGGSPTRQQHITKPLHIPKVDDRYGADAGLSASPVSQTASPSFKYPPDNIFSSRSSASSPLEMTASSSQSARQSLTRPQTISHESRIALPDEANQSMSSVTDSPTGGSRVIELGQSSGLSPAHSTTHHVPDSRDSTTDKSSTRRDLSDGEFLDLEDSDTSQDIRKSPDDPRQPSAPVQPPAADDFPLPPGIANLSRPSNSLPLSWTPPASSATERTRRMDGPESPTTPTPNAYSSRSSNISTYHSVIPEQESLVQFRALPLLPHDLPYTRVIVTNSSIRPNDRGKDVLSFVVLVDPGNQKEPYMIEKLYSDVLGLDQRIRSRYGKSVHKKIPHLPDGKLWRDHAPSRVDQRKTILEQYIQALINLPVKNNDEIIAFLTSDVIKETNKPVAREGYKEGYLTKRGKNFGGWKTRFFVLQGPQLEYYESRGGQHLGSINITGAQIGRQHRPADRRESEEEGEYRHAFLIIEAKKGAGGSHRHVLCAESDSERDSWVEILVRYVSGAYDEHASPHSSLYINTSATTSTSSSQPRSSTSSNAPVELPQPQPHRDRRQGQRGMTKEDINIGSAVPLSRLAPDMSNAKLFQITSSYEEASGSSSKNTNVLSSSEQLALFTDAQTARRLLDKGQLSLSHGAESPLSSSLPTTSPLDIAGGDSTPFIGPRANSELGHYSDLIDPQGSSGGGRNPQPSSELPRHRQGRRASLRPVLEPLRSSESPSPGDRPASPEGANQGASRADMPAKVKISGPMNGTPIPPGLKFGAKEPTTDPVQSERRDKVKSQKPTASTHVHIHRAVFGVTLEESLDVANIAGLPAIVFRCIEYLEKMKADQEEGIYRLSGSSAVIKSLKDKFNTEGDVDLLRSDEYWDPHAIAGLLKSFFRDLPSSILTRDLHMRFLSVMDLVNPQERIIELSQLIAVLPVANYSLLRALTAHLISVVQNANVNKMTMRNVGIVFSPTLGIPAGVFSLMLGEFNRVFNVNHDANEAELAADEKGSAIPRVADASGTDINYRNSKHYSDATTDELLGLSGRKLTGPEEDGPSDDAEELSVNTESGADTTDQDMMVESPLVGQSTNTHQTPPTQDAIPSSRSRASNLAAARGLGIRVEGPDGQRHSQVVGLPASPRPLARSPRTVAPPTQEGAASSISAPSQ